ncbi:hypothetical protein ACTXT7_006029 [Hymenolepis weldensis]
MGDTEGSFGVSFCLKSTKTATTTSVTTAALTTNSAFSWSLAFKYQWQNSIHKSQMVDAQAEKFPKKRKKALDISGGPKYDNDFKQKSPKKVRASDEVVKESAENTPKQMKPKRQPKFTLTSDSHTPGRNIDEGESKSAKRKSVHFAEELVLEESQTAGRKSILNKPILKPSSGDTSAIEATATAAGDNKQAASTERKKLSKNAVKRIKWVKRHRKKTVSKRKRKANLKLARSRPQRDVQDRVAKAVEYLNAWYESSETWKYQKIAQISLIKHAFNSQLVGPIAIMPINDDTFELLLHYLAGVQGSACDRIRSMCQQVIDNIGAQPESPALPLAIPESEDSAGVIGRAKRMLEFYKPRKYANLFINLKFSAPKLCANGAVIYEHICKVSSHGFDGHQCTQREECQTALVTSNY